MDDAMLKKIKKFHKRSDISKVQKFIGETRLNAEKSNGFVKQYLHNEANEIEKKLNKIL